MTNRALLYFAGLAALSACTAVLGVKDLPPDPSANQGASDGGHDAGDEALVAWAAADCKRFSDCSPGSFEYQFRDLAACQERVVGAYAWLRSLPNTGVTDAKLRDCATSVAALSCAEFNSSRSGLACDIKGTRALGQPCLDNVQCESGFCPSEYGCSTCQKPPESGVACANKQCAVGFACTSDNTCVTEAREGEACNATRTCPTPLYCAGGICKAPPATPGAACGSDAGAPYCDDRIALICSSGTSGTCLTFSVSGAGGGCGVSVDAGSAQLCRLAAKCTSGSCAAPPLAGEPCDATKGPYCTYPDRCVNGTCLALPTPSSCP